MNEELQTTIPADVGVWIERCVFKRSDRHLVNYNVHFHTHTGLQRQSKRQLIQICVALESTKYCREYGAARIISGYRTKNKDVIVQLIRRVIYTDHPICNHPVPDLMQELRSQVHAIRTTTTTTDSTVASRQSNLGPVSTSAVSDQAYATGRAYNPSVYREVHGRDDDMNPYIFPDPFIRTAGNMYGVGSPFGCELPEFYFNNTNQRDFQQSRHSSENHGAAEVLRNHSNSSGNKRNRDQAFDTGVSRRVTPTYIKPESALGDPDAKPKNAAELDALAQLQAMQFNDPLEILSSFRRLESSNGNPPSVDEVMIEIVTQREEVEEARKMDEARTLSELSQKEDARQKRLEMKEQLQSEMENCSVEEWSKNVKMFPKSWILRSEACKALESKISSSKSTLKVKVIELLHREKEARQWYGKELPSSYFSGPLSDRLLKTETVEDLLKEVNTELDTLQHAMFDLSQQKGGVPILLQDAYDQAHKNDENNDVVLVQDMKLPADKSHSNCGTRRSSRRLSSVDIIDLS